MRLGQMRPDKSARTKAPRQMRQKITKKPRQMRHDKCAPKLPTNAPRQMRPNINIKELLEFVLYMQERGCLCFFRGSL